MAEGKRVCVVDDDPDICSFCRTVLSGSGYAVETCLDTASGLAAIRAACPDLLILDVMMEEADSGFQMAKLLALEFPRLPILMLTSIAEEARLVLDISVLPIAGMIGKPIEPQALLRQVEQLLARGAAKGQ